MISGSLQTVKIPERIRTVFLVWLAWMLPFFSAHAENWNLPQLMQMMAQNKAGKASFVEKKYIGALDQPILSTGNLSFMTPDKLEKHTLTPKPESLILNGDQLTLDRPGKQSMTVSLEEYPEVATFIESIRGTLAGDRTALEKLYALKLTGQVENWQLVLTPKQERMSSIFSSIRISGSQAKVNSIELNQRDGDHSEMIITQIPDS
ncbi:MAG: outer membrane lipoprotein carrier protein LolA [Ferrovum sp.]|nr:outer membrane lipoprotein carrier protein LolA [Ferrovum sp.]